MLPQRSHRHLAGPGPIRATPSHSAIRFSSLAFGLAVLTGCPTDDVAAEGGGTEGDTGDEAAVDPLEGQGSEPPGDPDPEASWAPARSLGNGLVHDSRYDLDADPHTIAVSGAELASGVDWASFVSEHQAKIEVGFRPTQVHGIVELAPIGGGNFDLTITDRSVYLSDDDANYRTETRTYIFATPEDERGLLPSSGPGDALGPRPTAIDTFTIPDDDPPVGVSVVWTYDANPVPWRLIVGQPQAEFEETVDSLGQQGFRPISLASRRRAGQLEYAAIFVADGASTEAWRVTVGADAVGVAAAYSNWADGYYPSQRTYAQGSDAAPRHNLIWTERPPEFKVEVRENLNEALFEDQDKLWRSSGYHLESANPYVDGGQMRHHGIWVQYEPYMRWQGIEWDETDPLYIRRYRPLHDQAMQVMTEAGTPKEGDYFRPSATLHIFEADDLVLSRAYTYAPAIYPDTPENAPFALASVAKSITAAAVVRELANQGLPLSMPFWTAVGISPFPSNTSVPTVLDVLRNLGGFPKAGNNTHAYYDHHLIANSGYGPLPISGEAMFNYAEGENLFTAGQACQQDMDCTNAYGPSWKCDTEAMVNACVSTNQFWQESQYKVSQNGNALWYSNIGFTMLGELVRVRSGTSYPQYVIENFLAPLGLEDDIYPDKGHRYLEPEVTRASLRSYLIQDDHPYRLGTDPVQGSAPVPKPADGDGATPSWAPNAGPPDSNTPAFTDTERYAGKYYMGGAQLAAGGWVGRGEALGILMRATVRTLSVASQLWNPTWWNGNHSLGSGWQYVLGGYARGNWVAWAGGTASSMAIVLHNRTYDFTVVYLANVIGQPFGDFINPLLDGKGFWSQLNSPTSALGGEFPCQDELFTLEDECATLPGAPY
jgi:CubicO group peptidase (beta-lactamase class C family)